MVTVIGSKNTITKTLDGNVENTYLQILSTHFLVKLCNIHVHPTKESFYKPQTSFLNKISVKHSPTSSSNNSSSSHLRWQFTFFKRQSSSFCRNFQEIPERPIDHFISWLRDLWGIFIWLKRQFLIFRLSSFLPFWNLGRQFTFKFNGLDLRRRQKSAPIFFSLPQECKWFCSLPE